MSIRTDEFLFGMSLYPLRALWYFSVSQFNVDVLSQKSLSLHALDVKVKTKHAAFT